MQKRYCSCGQSVWVEYEFFGSMCTTRFRNDSGLENQVECLEQNGVLLECPCCKALLNINTLF